MTALKDVDSLTISQDLEQLEAFTGIEQKNSYFLQNQNGEPLFQAEETDSSFFSNTFLEAARPFTIHIQNQNQDKILQVERPWRWYFDCVRVLNPDGSQIGYIEKNFTLLQKEFSVHKGTGNGQMSNYTITGPIFSPWTFNIKKGNREVGKITKEWSGVGKEMITDEDNFGVEFSPDMDEEDKKLLLGAVFLIDFRYFESSD